MAGLGLSTLALVVAVPAVFAAAGAGTMALVLAGTGLGLNAIGLGASVGQLVHQIKDPELSKLMDESPEWAKFQGSLEAASTLTGIGAAAATALKDGLLKSLKAAKSLAEAKQVKNMNVDQIITKVQAMKEEEFASLCNALRGSRMRDLGGMVKYEALHKGSNLSIADKLPAYHIQDEFVSRLRGDFYRALYSDSKTVGAHFIKDAGNQIALASSAMPASMVGGSSGLVNASASAAGEAIASSLHSLTYFVAQGSPQ